MQTLTFQNHWSKTQARTWAKQMRQLLPITQLSRQICARLQSWLNFQAKQHILIYNAFNQEIEVAVLTNSPKKQFYVTRTWNDSSHLTIHHISSIMEHHPLGYLQPVAESEAVSTNLIDLVLVPGLCFDQQGIRLGYGMGFYDRLLTQMRPSTPANRCCSPSSNCRKITF